MRIGRAQVLRTAGTRGRAGTGPPTGSPARTAANPARAAHQSRPPRPPRLRRRWQRRWTSRRPQTGHLPAQRLTPPRAIRHTTRGQVLLLVDSLVPAGHRRGAGDNRLRRERLTNCRIAPEVQAHQCHADALERGDSSLRWPTGFRPGELAVPSSSGPRSVCTVEPDSWLRGRREAGGERWSR